MSFPYWHVSFPYAHFPWLNTFVCAQAARCHRAQLRLAAGNGYARFVAYTNLGLLYQEKYAVKKRQAEEKVRA